MIKRAFGWVQDPSNLSSLRRVVEIFCPDSSTHAELVDIRIPNLISKPDGRDEILEAMHRRPLRLSYLHLVGTAFFPRSSARCNGIVQAAIPGQKRQFIADWPADNFVRWAHALGFISWDESDDHFTVTDSGISLSQTDVGSDEEYRILSDAMLSYPPAVRVVNLLAEAESGDESIGLTKYEIGRQLGFQGESGFTTISQNYVVREICYALPEDAKRIKSNWEGSSDKYARMICAWLGNLKYPWVRKGKRTFVVDVDEEQRTCHLVAYFLTAKGFEEKNKSIGQSSHRRISKYLPASMLCPNAPGRDLLIQRRARIVKKICSRPVSIDELEDFLAEHGFTQPRTAVEADLDGLENIGLVIERREDNRFRCYDKIHGLEIPIAHDLSEGDEIRVMTEACAEYLREIPRDFLVLIQLAFDGSRSKIFELKIAELMTEFCKFRGSHLGGSDRPDGAFYSDKWGLIVDAKSYAGGFSIPGKERDKMFRYLNDLDTRPSSNTTKWWRVFPDSVVEFLFMFVSGKFGGDFRRQLQRLGESTQGKKGAAVSAQALLLLAEKIARNEMSHTEFKRRISVLDKADLTGCDPLSTI